MKAYGKAFGRDTGQWSLLSTGEENTINQFAGNVGLKFTEKEGSFIHNLRTVVVDRQGKIARIFTDENWEVGELVAEIKRLGESGE